MLAATDWFSRIFSIVAIFLSASGIVWTIIRDRRRDELDRGKLNAFCRLIYDEDERPTHIEVRMVNEGRRPVVLAGLHLEYGDGSSTINDFPGKNLRLEEGGSHRQTISPGNEIRNPRTGEMPLDIKVEDTSGRLFEIKDAKDSLARLWAARH